MRGVCCSFRKKRGSPNQSRETDARPVSFGLELSDVGSESAVGDILVVASRRPCSRPRRRRSFALL